MQHILLQVTQIIACDAINFFSLFLFLLVCTNASQSFAPGNRLLSIAFIFQRIINSTIFVCYSFRKMILCCFVMTRDRTSYSGNTVKLCTYTLCLLLYRRWVVYSSNNNEHKNIRSMEKTHARENVMRNVH